MWWFTLGRDTVGGSRTGRLPPLAYVKGSLSLPAPLHDSEALRAVQQKRPWILHLMLMLSYVTMLMLIMFFLDRMWSGPEIDWRVHAFGYLASVGLLGATIYALRGRIKKVEEHYRHSHESDWMFLVLLIIVAATGILQHVLHRGAPTWPQTSRMSCISWRWSQCLGWKCPFSKWSHMAYRPLAMYFSVLREQIAPLPATEGMPGDTQTEPVA